MGGTFERLKEKALIHFANEGFENASLSLIAKDAGITKGTIYSHFKNKEALLLAVMDDVCKSFETDIASMAEHAKIIPNIKERLHYLFFTIFKKTHEPGADIKARFWQRFSLSPYSNYGKDFHDRISNTLNEHFFPVIMGTIEEGVKIKLIKPVEVDVAAQSLFYIINSFIQTSLSGCATDQLDRHLNFTWTIVWMGISETEQVI